MKQIFTSLLLILILLTETSDVPAQTGSRQQPLRVGVYNNSPKIFTDANGKPAGIFIDILAEIARREQLSLVFVTGSWDELYTKLRLGQIDVLPDMAQTPARDSLFRFNQIAVFGSWIEIFTLKTHPLKVPSELNGKTIGVLQASVQQQYIRSELIDRYGLSCRIRIFSDNKSALHLIKNGHIDAIAADRFFNYNSSAKSDLPHSGIVFHTDNLYYGFSKQVNINLIQHFDLQLTNLKNDPESVYYTSVIYWLHPQNPG